MSPHRFAWGFSYDAPLAAVAAGVTLFGVFTSRERQSPFQGAPLWILAAFVVWVTLSYLFGSDVNGNYPIWTKVMKIYLMIFVSVVLLHNKYHIMAFAWVTTFSLALLGAKGGLFTILNGGNHRVYGPAGSFIEDNNELALALVMTIPLLHFLQLQLRNRWHRHAISVVMLLCAASALGSHSRGGLLGLAAMGALFWVRSSRKGLVGAVILTVSLAMIAMMPEEWWERMRSIGSYQEDGSAQGRLYAWRVAWAVASNHLFGGGMSYQYPSYFAIYGDGPDTVIAAHSIYFQILGNHGIAGLILYVSIWLSTFRSAGWLRKHASAFPQSTWAASLGAMAQVSLVGYLVGGAFLSLSYFDLPYDIMVLVVLARKWVETRG
jgi:probable O-glycosylation ligase (exosortase A-associated)